MKRLGLTLCEIALCTPMELVNSDEAESEYRYDGVCRSRIQMLADVKDAFGIWYRAAVEKLFSLAEDPDRAVAPLDVVCEALEQVRADLQQWHDIVSSHEERLACEPWYEQLLRDHEQRTIEAQKNFQLPRKLRSTKDRSVQERVV